MTTRLFFICVITLSTFASLGFTQELVEWRGINRTGIYNETGLLKEWPEEGPTQLWHYDGLGRGFTSVTIADGTIYTTGETEGTGFVYAFDDKGQLKWKSEYGKEWSTSYPGTRTTPVYYKGFLYIATGLAEAMCIDAKTGKKIWSVDMKTKFGARDLRWGIVESPVVDGNRVFFTPGGDGATVVALDVKTGATIWELKGLGESSAYCSPLLYEHNNKKYLTTSLTNNLIGVDISNGTLAWKVSQVNQHSIHPNTPIYKDGFLYSISGYRAGGVMIKLSDDGKATELWRNTTMDNQIGGAVWVDNYIVSSGHQNDRNWQCLDAKTGEVIHKTNALGKGTVVYADGLFYCYSDNGELGIMEIGADGFKLKSKFRIHMGTDQHWAHPVIHQGVLYMRRGNTLMAYSIKK